MCGCRATKGQSHWTCTLSLQLSGPQTLSPHRYRRAQRRRPALALCSCSRSSARQGPRMKLAAMAAVRPSVEQDRAAAARLPSSSREAGSLLLSLAQVQRASSRCQGRGTIGGMPAELSRCPWQARALCSTGVRWV